MVGNLIKTFPAGHTSAIVTRLKRERLLGFSILGKNRDLNAKRINVGDEVGYAIDGKMKAYRRFIRACEIIDEEIRK